MTNGNGTNGNGSRYYWWVMGLAATLLAGGVSSTLHRIISTSERLAVLETKLDNLLDHRRPK